MNKRLESFIPNSKTDPTLAPVSLDTTATTVTYYDDMVVTNEHAQDGLLYVETLGYNTATAGFTPKVYSSFNGYQWFLNTSLPVTDTGGSIAYPLDNLGKYIKFGYTAEVKRNISKVRVMLELNETYD